MSGMMGFHEFKELSQVLNSWKMTFSSYDQDRSGTVEPHELQKAIASMGTATTAPYPSIWVETARIYVWIYFCAGYNLSPQAMNVIVKRFSTNNRITFDEFIACCVKLRALTGEWAGGKHQPFQMSSIQQRFSDTHLQISSERETHPKTATPPFNMMT